MGRMPSHILWKIKHVPNPQPGYIDIVIVINHIYGSFFIGMLNNQRVYSYRFPKWLIKWLIPLRSFKIYPLVMTNSLRHRTWPI
jgi:hypothetical protein